MTPTLTTSMAMMMMVMMLTMAPVMTVEMEIGIVFTSMMKLQQLARMEGELLQWLDDSGNDGEIADHIKQFAESRHEVRRQHDHVELHPNTGYLLICAFLDYWMRIFEDDHSLKELEDKTKVDLPNGDDIFGALRAILHLQSIYNLPTLAVYSGNYSGYLGPALSPRDALELGAEAFEGNDYQRSTSWLQLARDEIERARQETERSKKESEQPKEESEWPKEEPGRPKEETEHPKVEMGRAKDKMKWAKEETEQPKQETERSKEDMERSKEETERSKEDRELSAESTTPSSKDQDPEGQEEEEPDLREDVLCLLGRTYLKLGDREKAEELLKEASELPIVSTGNETSPDREALEKELNPPPAEKEGEENGEREEKLQGVPVEKDPQSVSQTMRHLCHQHRSTTLSNLKPFHMCRHKPSFLVPFLLYKEEILSLSPYVSLFHDFISNSEIEVLKGTDKKLKPFYSRTSPKSIKNTKTGQYRWMNDSESEVAATLSRRLSDMVWLDADDRKLSTAFTAEGWQVMNYGLGGYDSNHTDYITNTRRFNRSVTRYKNRLASFLLHLSDIDMGGQIVFEQLNISVAPVKGLGVFWYNQSPIGELEPLTEHAACPVLKGDKWVAHKWILETGNMLRRPCGPDPNCSQLDLEAIMYDRRGLPWFPKLPNDSAQP